MQTPRQQRGQHRYERILDAAVGVFAQRGYHDTAMDEVARAAETSKGGLYFHFPAKQALFLALLDRMASLLRGRVEAAVAEEPDPVAQADIALQVVLQTFASHRSLARLFFVEALGAGSEVNARMAAIRSDFAALIQRYLDAAVQQGALAPLNTAVASRVWFGALNEVVTSWLLAPGEQARLEDAYPTLRALLLRGIGIQVPDPAPAAGSLTIRGRRTASANEGWDGEHAAHQWRQALESAAAQARQVGRLVLASLVVPAPWLDAVDVYASLEAGVADRCLWLRPRTGFALVAAGCTWSFAADEAAPFATADRAWRALLSDASNVRPDDVIGVGPLLQGGFAFDPWQARTDVWRGFPSARLVLPEVLYTQVDGRAWMTFNALIDAETALEAPGLDRPRLAEQLLRAAPSGSSNHGRTEFVSGSGAAWQQRVANLVSDMAAEGAEKVVLARSSAVTSVDGPFDTPAALRRLRADFPGTFVFAVEHDGRTFLGATPERLARLRDGVVTTMCLAGSTRRGESEAEDRLLGDQLLADPKERFEHDVVVRGLRESLARVCQDVAPTSTPVLLKLRNVQHLLTTVVGRAADDTSLLGIVGALHPTPAVGGYPRETALRLIREREGLDRGWYAGPIGWLDARGEGEFAVALRSGVLDGERAVLFAGCGIVPESQPEAEYAESELKLRPMRSALGVEQA